MTIVSITETSKNVWRLTFNGRALGDSRGYDKARAWEEAKRTVARDQSCNGIDGYISELTLGEKP